MPAIEELPLHDAIVKKIVYRWNAKIIEFELLAFIENGKDATQHILRFGGVSNFNFPHTSPWGESSCINEATGMSGEFSIEMQSGDTISISAENCSFEPIAS
jgi:hypothetical protein